jgi:glucosamine 6-phosphate synthetase-like amidotransferase/phosphosugar isomerase protein
LWTIQHIGLQRASEPPWLQRRIDSTIRYPSLSGFLSPILHTVPLQLLAYHAALERGNDVDKPRNLAKSVTVE